MKKLILSLSLLSLISFKGEAQNNPKNPLTTGFKAGLNMTNISAGENSQEFKPSYHAGGFVEIPLSYYKQYALQIELLYSNQGYKGKEIEKRDQVTGKIIETNKLEDVSLHYLTLPVMFKYYIQENFAVEVGPQVSYLMDAKGDFDIYRFNEAREYLNTTTNPIDNALFENGYRSTKYEDYYERLDYGIAAGISYNFNNGLYLSGRYYYGLQDIYKADNKYSKIPNIPTMPGVPQAINDEINRQNMEINRINKSLDLSETKNSVIQISIGYKF